MLNFSFKKGPKKHTLEISEEKKFKGVICETFISPTPYLI